MRLSLLAAAAILSASLAAHADTMYSIGPVTFTLPTNPTPSTLTIGNSGYYSVSDFILNGVVVNQGAQSYVETVEFAEVLENTGVCYSLAIGGPGTQTSCSGGIINAGTLPYFDYTIFQPLFSGSVSNPTLLSGTFNGQFFGSSIGGGYPLPLLVTSTSVTPEPSSIALLGTGMLGLAAIARKRFA